MSGWDSAGGCVFHRPPWEGVERSSLATSRLPLASLVRDGGFRAVL